MNPEVPIRHASDDELHLYVLNRVSAGELDVLERHLFDCADCKERLAVAVELVAKILNLSRQSGDKDKRAEPRFRVCDALFLRCLAPLQRERWSVQIVDVSKNGLGLLAPTKLSPGVVVQIQSGTTFALGEVRHSRRISEHQFHIGIKLQDVVAAPWSPAAHLNQA